VAFTLHVQYTSGEYGQAFKLPWENVATDKTAIGHVRMHTYLPDSRADHPRARHRSHHRLRQGPKRRHRLVDPGENKHLDAENKRAAEIVYRLVQGRLLLYL